LDRIRIFLCIMKLFPPLLKKLILFAHLYVISIYEIDQFHMQYWHFLRYKKARIDLIIPKSIITYIFFVITHVNKANCKLKYNSIASYLVTNIRNASHFFVHNRSNHINQTKPTTHQQSPARIEKLRSAPQS